MKRCVVIAVAVHLALLLGAAAVISTWTTYKAVPDYECGLRPAPGILLDRIERPGDTCAWSAGAWIDDYKPEGYWVIPLEIPEWEPEWDLFALGPDRRDPRAWHEPGPYQRRCESLSNNRSGSPRIPRVSR